VKSSHRGAAASQPLSATKRQWRDLDCDDFEAAFEDFEGDSEEDEMMLLSFSHKPLSPLFPRGEDGLRVHVVACSCNLQSCRCVFPPFLNYCRR
jgi:hypothetical protein